MNRQPWHSAYISRIASRGSSPFPNPRPKQPRNGNTRSRASACSTRAPPMNEPSAEEKPTITMPTSATYGVCAMSWNTVKCVASVSCGNASAASVNSTV